MVKVTIKKGCYRPRPKCYKPCANYSMKDEYDSGSSPSSYGDGEGNYSGGYSGNFGKGC